MSRPENWWVEQVDNERCWATEKFDIAYTTAKIKDPHLGMKALRQLFPDAKANDLNFVLFSTSGTHGHYGTIEQCERDRQLPGVLPNYDDSEDEEAADLFTDVTFVVVQPRLIVLRYGKCIPRSDADIEFLKRLRASSWDAVQKIGAPCSK